MCFFNNEHIIDILIKTDIIKLLKMKGRFLWKEK
jgi:hypothetical protein